MDMTLKPLALFPFTSKEIKPRGWMRRQLEIQAAGLAGNLDKIWPDVADSSWIGGSHDSWERVPYWLDGFIPLAYLLDDEDLKARAKKYIDAILARQEPDGWLCPCERKERSRYDTWALELISKVLVLWYDCSGDERVPNALYRAMKQFDRHTDRHLVLDWGSTRWFEVLFALYRLYEWYGEEWILSLADKMGAIGVDWKRVFTRWQYEKPRYGDRATWGQLHHVVNNEMMLKSAALYSRVTGEDPTAFFEEVWGKLSAAHGQPYGVFSGDECLAGTSPIAGTELCSVVEAMFSFETLLSVTGDPAFADKTEFAGFNALPATLSPDMWTHQYVQMANQIACRVIPKEAVHFTTNTGEAHLYGLEPHYGCCTSNMGQGFPKLCLSSFFRKGNGIASAVLVPAELHTQIDSADVCVTLDTDYPFRGSLTYTVSVSHPVRFPFFIRIPGFAKSATVDGKPAAPGAFFEIDREWSGSTTVQAELSFDAELRDGYDGMKSVVRGPLLFALNIDAEWHPLEYVRDGVVRKFPYCDYELLPASEWQYALAGTDFIPVELPLDGACRFSPESAPLALETDLVRIDWGEANGVAAATPRDRTPIGEKVRARLIPYGCTNLRLSVMPFAGIAPISEEQQDH